MDQLLKLNQTECGVSPLPFPQLIHKHVGDEKAEWMTGIAVYAQQIIVNVRYGLLCPRSKTSRSLREGIHATKKLIHE